MNYNLQLRKFIYSQYVYTGIRITAGVVIPGILLQHFHLLGEMISIPLGALFIALTDAPGPKHHRLNGMVASLITNATIVLLAAFSHSNAWLVGVELITISMLFSLLAVYGNRANTIGLIALIAFILNINQVGHINPFLQALYLTLGGVWYLILSMLSNAVRPYQPVQQLLGEYLTEMGAYLEVRSFFYTENFDASTIVQQLLEKQVKIHEQQDELREAIFKTRLFLNEATHTGRRLTMIFVDSIDLFERIMTAQQDYTQLHEWKEAEPLLQTYRSNILQLANALHYTGVAVQAGDSFSNKNELESYLENSRQLFSGLRKQKLTSATVEIFIRLRQILFSIEDVTLRMHRLQSYTYATNSIEGIALNAENVKPFITPSNFDVRLLVSNISLKSTHFKHALRLAIGMLVGYIITLFFPIGHGYWILLTIATIVKPAYSISRTKNIQRVAGTIIGVGLGFITLSITKQDTPIFIIMLIAMMVAYIFLRLHYLVSTAGITLYVLLNFHFLYPGGLANVLSDRLIDTLLGGVIAFGCSFIFPVWEHKQIQSVLKEALKANAQYLAVTVQRFSSTEVTLLSYQLARKEAFITLANLSGALQRMLYEPKSRQPFLPQYHQLVTASHTLTSYIASLSWYTQQYAHLYVGADFEPMSKQVQKQINTAIGLLSDNATPTNIDSSFPVNKKVQQLLAQRKKQLEEGVFMEDESIRKRLSEMKSITDQFQLISAVINDQIRIISQLRTVS